MCKLYKFREIHKDRKRYSQNPHDKNIYRSLKIEAMKLSRVKTNAIDK